MKKINLIMLTFLLAGGLMPTSQTYSADIVNPIAGKIIALDAGHGAGDPGAIGNCDGIAVNEAEVNFVVRAKLVAALTAQGASVFEVPQLSTRKERVAAAEEAGADILISIHHNGSLDTEMDYSETFITQTKYDKPLALFVHPAVYSAIKSVDSDIADHGITNSGFGMTVFGDHPAVLTESYFITNTEAACDYVNEQNRVTAEVDGLYNGILNYFALDGEAVYSNQNK